MLLYSFAYASQQHEIDLHSLVGMGNHVHETLTDTCAELPDFCHWAHTMIARALNGWMGRRGCFWDGTRSYNACLLGVKGEVDPLEYAEDVLDKMVYCAVNPVRAGLVKHARDWPGINSARWHIGEPITVERPRLFFSEKSDLPQQITFSFVKPPGFPDLDDAGFDRLFRERVRDEELEIAREMKVAGRRFAGAENVLKMERKEAPKRPEPATELVPEAAAKDPDRRWSMLQLIAAFRARYDTVRRAWIEGDESVVFPMGTFKIRRESPARCRGPDPACPLPRTGQGEYHIVTRRPRP